MVSASRKKENEVRSMLSKKAADVKQSKAKERVAAAKVSKAGKSGAAESRGQRSTGAMVDDVQRSSVQVPPHSYDVHIKNAKVMVEVTLHHVQPAAINIDETTDTKLIVDTTKGFGRKYRLEFDFPDKMTVDAQRGEYTFDSGILTCEFPVKHMPKTIVQSRQKLIDSVTAGKKRRFEEGERQGLAVRSRVATMEKPEEAPSKSASGSAAAAGVKSAATTPAASAASAAARRAEEDAQVEALQVELAAKRKRMEESKGGKQPPQDRDSASAPSERSKEKQAPSASANPRKQYVSDEAALEMAKSAGRAVQQNLMQRVKQAQQLQQQRLQRAQVRSQHKETKDEKQQRAYERILEEKKAELARKAQLAAAPERKAVAAGASPKAVKFAK